MGLENPIHLVIVLMVVLLVFGAKRLPEMGRSLGDGMRGFKEAISGQPPAVQAMNAHIQASAASVESPVPVAVATAPVESPVLIPVTDEAPVGA